MTSLLSPDSRRSWICIGLIAAPVFCIVWITSNCTYDPDELGSLQTICGNSASATKQSPRTRRNTPPANPTPQQVAITQDKDLVTTFWYNSSNTHVAAFSFDYCNIVSCPPVPWQCNLYRDTPKSRSTYICVTDDYWGQNCDYWGSVGWNTGTDWGYKPQSALSKKDHNGKSLISRMTLLKTGTCLNNGKSGQSMKFTLTIENPRPSDAGTYILGTWAAGAAGGKQGRFLLKDMYQSNDWFKLNAPVTADNPLKPSLHTFKEMIAIGDPTYEDTLAIETGFSDTNYWLEWMKYNAISLNRSNCYVCGKARPHLGTVPLNIPENVEDCFLSLFTANPANITGCSEWMLKYPILSKKQNPGSHITIYPGNYTCYISNNSGRDLKKFPPGYCRQNRTTNIANQTKSLGDIYWICGDMKIRTKLEGSWKGECALAKIIMPLHIVTEVDPPLGHNSSNILRRARREAPGGSFDPHVYIDTIGVPRGVPNEFKARDQVAAGFESLIPMITINKNVDWINYIYYNQQRFVNDTRDALKGIAEQLEPTSQMVFQNRMALDMVLAEKGGTCVYIGKTEGCCTWIPDNTGPNGKVTLAIKRLEDLSVELKKNSGIDNPWDQYFGWFTSWKHVLVQFAIIICVILLVVGIVVCCIIPCFKKLLNKGIENVTMLSHSIPECQVPLTPDPDEYTEYVKKHKQKKRKNLII